MFIKTVSNQTKTLEPFFPNEILLIIDNFLRTTVFKEKQKSLEQFVLNMIKSYELGYIYLPPYYNIYNDVNNCKVVERWYEYNIIYVRREHKIIKPGIGCEIIQEIDHYKNGCLIRSYFNIYKYK